LDKAVAKSKMGILRSYDKDALMLKTTHQVFTITVQMYYLSDL